MASGSRQRIDLCSGSGLREATAFATAWLERNVSAVNALNVFPVPDGDTGTNMFLTMQSALRAVAHGPALGVGDVARGLAQGALMGARGNSGVILSQILRGFAREIDEKLALRPDDLGRALCEASTSAYRGVSKPVEGTMLTVAREAAAAAERASVGGGDLFDVIDQAASAAHVAVANTPAQLAVLREAGVVDAGGQGLFVLLDGVRRHLRGETIDTLPEPVATDPRAAISAEFHEAAAGKVWGYCTEFLVQGQHLEVDDIRRQIAPLGDSLLVVGDETLVRVHVHTLDPGAALRIGTAAGALIQVKVENMDQQREHFAAATGPSGHAPAEPVSEVSIVTVASGAGLVQLCRSLGAHVVVPGGQTMNPSTEDLVRAIEAAPTSQVLLLPNNPNIQATAKQAAMLSAKRLVVVPSETIPQGVAALLAFNYQAGLDENAGLMRRAIGRVHTGEVTRATRAVRFDGVTVRVGQPIGLIDGRLAVAEPEEAGVVDELLRRMEAASGEVITVYYGAGADRASAEVLAEQVRRAYPDQAVELVDGGQPHYSFIISVE